MTEIMVARRDGVLTEPDGTKHRLHRGRTLADGRHPAVVARPEAWMPMTVHLSVDDAPAGPGPEVEVNELLAKAADIESERNELVNVLNGIATILEEHGYRASDKGEPGWLPRLVKRALTMPAPEPVAPPRKATPRKVAPPKAGADG